MICELSLILCERGRLKLPYRGKNVCIYHILDSCKFGASRCVYSHSKEALPKRGWWSSPEKVAKVKEVLEVAEKNVRDQRQAEFDKWKAHVREMRNEAKARQTLGKQMPERALQPFEGADMDKNTMSEKASEVSVKEKDAVKSEIAQAKEGSEVEEESKHGEKNTVHNKTTAGPSTTNKKAKPKREGRKKVEGGQQKKAGDGVSGDAPSSPAVAKKRAPRYRQKNVKTGNEPSKASSAAVSFEGPTHPEIRAAPN